jgi:hypothetical protein
VTTRTWGWLAAVIDVVLIVLFALIGRSSHGETLTLGGLWLTAYPFLAGWAIAYVTSGAWARPLAFWPTGGVAWILTIFVGMAIRVATGQGVDNGNPLPISFLIVATVVVGVFLMGWRAIARPLVGRAERRADAARSAHDAHEVSVAARAPVADAALRGEDLTPGADGDDSAAASGVADAGR